MPDRSGPDRTGPDPAPDAGVALLDELAARATGPPPLEVLGGWLLRAAPDLPFRRSNAVVPLPGGGPLPGPEVARRLAVVEDFYRQRMLPPRLQISPASDPADLDERLAARGYVVDAPVDVLVAWTSEVRAVVPADDPSARLEATLDPAWVAGFGDPGPGTEDDRTRARLGAYRALLAGIEPTSVAALVDVDDVPTSVGIGVAERGHVGIFGMATCSAGRRRGGARAVLSALARWAGARGARRLYLQVEVDNDPARALYESAGFTRHHGYHYRVLA